MVSQSIRKTTRVCRQLASGPSKLVAAFGSLNESRNGLTMGSHANIDVSGKGVTRRLTSRQKAVGTEAAFLSGLTDSRSKI